MDGDNRLKKPGKKYKLLLKITNKRTVYTKRRRDGKVFQRKLRPYTSLILNLITGLPLPNFRKKRFNHVVSVPKTFSLIDNPEESLRAIYKLANAARSHPIKELFFNHSNMHDFDLSAELLLDLVAKETDKEHKSRKRKFDVSGHYPLKSIPNYTRSKRFLKSSGIIKSLNVTHEFLTTQELETLNIFEASSLGAKDIITSGLSSYHERVVDKFVQHIDKCLSCVKRELTDQGRNLLADYMSEIIENIEWHSNANIWRIMAYLDTAKDANFTCEIAIINLGRSFAQTIGTLPIESYTRKQIQPIVDVHRQNNYFSSKWTLADIFTLLALQGDVSSKNNHNDSTRGQGTVKLINFFQQMHDECNTGTSIPTTARMTIISGGTHIYFNGKYKMTKNARGNPRIAFNASNSLDENRI